MKKSVKMLLAVCAFAFTVLLVSGTESKAAVNLGLKQTDAGSNSVDLEWNAYLGAGCYHVEFSADGKTWTKMGDSSTPKDYIYNLGANTAYYARVVVYGGSHYSGETAIAVSETVVVATEPSKVQNLTQTGATANSISMSWSPVAGANGYVVYSYVNSDWVQVATSTSTSATISGLPASSKLEYRVAATRAVTGGTIVGSKSDYVYMRTIPAQVSRVAMTDFYDNINVAYYGWTYVNNVDGYQFQLLNNKGKSLLNSYESSTSIRISPYYKGVFTKARVRAYITVGNTRLYGPWSGYNYNASSKSVKMKRTKNRKKITVTWKKITGASGYRVYISTKSTGGWKKVKSLSSKKKSCTITKYGKKKLSKKKTYYVKVQYLTKVGKKNVASGVSGVGSI